MEGWVDPRAGLDAVAKTVTIPFMPFPEPNLGLPASSLVIILTDLLWLQQY